jgi:hypothetical protein
MPAKRAGTSSGEPVVKTARRASVSRAPARPPQAPAGKGRRQAKPARALADADVPAHLAASPDALARIEASVAALREEVAVLGRALGAQASAPAQAGRATSEAGPASTATADDPQRSLEGLLARFTANVEMLAVSAAEVPKAEDFEPLADHLYAFAQSAPRLLESLEAVRLAMGPLEAAAHSLVDVSETLAATHQSWSDSLLRLPRAEDYEPLAGPLREFARVSPALAESLGSVVRAVAPLPDLVRQLSETAQVLRALPTAPPPSTQGSDGAPRAALAGAADALGEARMTLRAALATLPRDPVYAKVAAQLRELASVSPSLLEWLQQVPSISLPLGEAVAAIRQAVGDLDEAERAARRVLGERPAGSD